MTEFNGFHAPEQNYSRLPHEFIEVMPSIETISEMKCVLYIIRHTWGYSEYRQPKRMSVSDFMYGRKKRDGSRIDSGTGLSKHSVIDGLRRAEKHGIISVETVGTDAGRIRKFYRLIINRDEEETGAEFALPPVQSLHYPGAEVAPRTKKATKESNDKKNDKPRGFNADNEKTVKGGDPTPGKSISVSELEADLTEHNSPGIALAKKHRQAIGEASKKYSEDPIYKSFVKEQVFPKLSFTSKEGKVVYVKRENAVRVLLTGAGWEQYAAARQPEQPGVSADMFEDIFGLNDV